MVPTTVRPLRAWSPADRQHLSSSLHSALRRWAQAWSLQTTPWLDSDVAIEVANNALAAIESRSWRSVGVDGVWWSLMASGSDRPRLDTPRRALLSALFSETKKPLSATHDVRICEQLADDAWRDCRIEFGRLVSAQEVSESDALDDAPSSLPPDVTRAFGGALLAHLPWCGQSLALLMDGDRVGQALKRSVVQVPSAVESPRPAVAPLPDVLSRHALPIRIELQSIDIDLGSLAGLRIGDVLCTGHRLDEPLNVRAPSPDHDAEPNTLCDAFLGRQTRWRAVELRRRAAELNH